MSQVFNNIEAIVLDLGGVVIDLKRDNAVAALQQLGLEKADEMLDTYRQSGAFLKLETGKLTAAEFFDEVRHEIGNTAVTDRQIQDAFNQFLVALPVERLEAIRAMRAAGKKVYALSNTNPVMFHSWIAEQFRQEGLEINDYFDGIVTSFQEGSCKPDQTIFRHLIRRYNLQGDRTLFLDDGPANVLAAEQAGIRAVHVTPENDLINIFSCIR